MLIFGATTKPPCYYSHSGGCSMICQQERHHNTGEVVTCSISRNGNIKRRRSAPPLVPMQMITAAAVSAVSLATVILVVVEAGGTDASEIRNRQQQQQHGSEETGTLSNIPQTLSSDCISSDCKKVPRIQRPKSRKAEVCTVKCVTTCIRGGLGSPGEGPLNVRRPLVVFKQGFRTRQYCLAECSDICNLIGDADDGPKLFLLDYNYNVPNLVLPSSSKAMRTNEFLQ